MASLAGKVAVITGASSGIGQGIAVEFAKKGAALALVSRNREKLENTVKLCRDSGLPQDKVIDIIGDVRYDDDLKRIAGETISKLKTVDILVNNAGSLISTTTRNLDLSELDKQYQQSVRGPLHLSHLLLDHLIENKGNIINMSSVAGWTVIREVTYSTMKGAMNQLTRCMALELAPYHVRVNTINPGFTHTDLPDNAYEVVGDSRPGYKDLFGKIWHTACYENPWKRPGRSEEVGKLAAFLASDDASYITGAHMVIDGGLLLTSYFTTHTEQLMKDMMNKK